MKLNNGSEKKGDRNKLSHKDINLQQYKLNFKNTAILLS